MPQNVSSKGLVKSAKKEARAAEKKAEDMPLAKVSWDTGFFVRGEPASVGTSGLNLAP